MAQLGEYCAPLNIPPWQPGVIYPGGFVVVSNGALYVANVALGKWFVSAATWNADSANWTLLAGAAA